MEATMENDWTKRIEELEAENERLREALKYIAFTTPGPTMKTHSEAAEQALSVILSERDKEEIVRFVKPDAQAVERERDQWRDLCARQGMQLKNVERENGELKAEKIRIEKVMQLGCQDSESVCPYWQTVKDWEKECESLELKITNLQAALSAAQGEVERLRELVDGARVIVEVFQWSTPAQERWREEWLKKAAKAMKEASHESK
jgi:wobble nucleotide-excising tRNase